MSFRRSSTWLRHPAALLLLALLFGWQSLASAMALPCRVQAQPPVSHPAATKVSHEAGAPAHAEHCAGMKQPVKPQHDCDGLCADHHCAGVAFALPPTLAASAEPPLAHVDALFIVEPLRNGSSSELIRPPSRS